MAPQDREKKGGLTLEKLASYDDVITDALVDKVYYWTTIRKNRGGRFSASRGLHAEDIGDIIRKHIVLNKDPTEAVQHLLRLPGLRKYLSSLKDEKEKEHFTRHLRRYVSIYMPDCPFEVTTTNRYTISEHEASIKARRDINPREEIKYLTGVQVAMTEEQEKTLELARKDFSLVISSRKKTRSLFLGPARFANHDCDANARLSTKGYDGMQIVAVKPIAFGDEITVSYGEDYFGEDNEECLCHTCEEKQVNGWAPFKRVETDSDEDEDEDEDDEEKTPAPEEPLPEQDGSYSFRRKRKYGTTIEENSSETLPASKRVKVEVKKVESSPEEKPQSPSKRHAPQPLRKRTLKKAYSASSLRKEVPVSSIENTTTNLSSSTQLSREIRTQQRVGLLTVTLDETSTSREDTPDSSLPSILADSPKSSESTDATSVDEDQPMANTEQISKVDLDVIKQKPGLGVVTVKTETTIATPSWTALFDGDSSSDISDLSDSLDF